ncbi:MAG: hypothetical protein HUJ68_12075 [Clostridia bacterium]|nr:hypothetical protein [Clostridia bacterium]
MSETDKQKAVEALEAIREAFMPIIEEIVETARKIIKVIAKAVKKIFRKIVVCIVKQLGDKKACKCLHIWLHTRNKRIRKKQSKRLNNIILSYMPL